MEEADKKSKSEGESEERELGWIDRRNLEYMRKVTQDLEARIKALERHAKNQQKRIKALEEHLMSLDHGHEQGNNPDDGGWFD
jgi:predicted RNase H-like nuclease (RuvC/YqgF family)